MNHKTKKNEYNLPLKIHDSRQRRGSSETAWSTICGFSLIELIVVIGIFTVISGILLADYPEFGESMALKRTSQEIALTIRQAQSYAFSVKEFSSQFVGYGVNFDTGTPDFFTLFSDILSDNLYSEGDGCGGSSTECFRMFKIQTGDRIIDLCGTPPSGTEICGLNKLNTVFLRPKISVNLNDGEASPTYFDSAKIIVMSPRGKTATINVYLSGQISVE